MSLNLLAVALGLESDWPSPSRPLLAHHSEAAEYDVTKPVKSHRCGEKVEWTNPHIWFYVEGKDEVSGLSAVWGFSGAAPNGLQAQGY